MSILQSNESHITINADGASKEVRFQNNGTQNMVLDSSGNVGIGTTSPTHTLEVNGGANNQVVKLVSTDAYAAIGLQDSTSSTDGSGNSYNSIAALGNNLTFWANNTERMRIDSSGNVGIGTTSPTSPLTIKSNSLSSQSSGLVIQANSSTNDIVRIAEKSTDGGRFHMFEAGVEKIAFYTDGTDNHISAGNLGIGTTTPNTPLSGATGIVMDSGSAVDCQLRLQNDTTGNTNLDGGLLSISGSDMYLWNYENSTLRFGTNSTERMRIDSAGNLILKGSSDVGNRLQINGADETSELLEVGITSGHVQFTATHASGGANTAGYIFRTRHGGTTNEKMRIQSDGSLLLGTTDGGASVAGDIVLSGGIYLGGNQAANYLDEYEEGTWTPVLVGSSTSGTATYTYQVGSYVKVGNLVTVNGYLNWNSHTGGGYIYIQGLPFNVSSTGVVAGLGTVLRDSFDTPGDTVDAHLYISAGNNRIEMFISRDNLSWQQEIIEAAAQWIFQITYRAAS